MASSRSGTARVFMGFGLLTMGCHDSGPERGDEAPQLAAGERDAPAADAEAQLRAGLALAPDAQDMAEYARSVGADGETARALEPPPFTAGSTVFAVLPDTQYYSLGYPGVLDIQTWWLADNADALGIAYAFHLGDIVHKNTDLEWERASDALRLLDGVVPYALVPGNHDYGPSGSATTRDTGLNTWFSFAETAAMPSFGGAFEPGKLDNTYHLFAAGGHEWIALMLEWAPRDEVVAWADAVMTEHPERLGILVTHAYLNNNDLRYDHTDADHPQQHNPHGYTTPGSLNDGEELWQKLVRRHRFAMTLNGHVLGDGTGYLASVDDHGRVVHQMLANYQMREVGGEGYLRLLELLPDGRTMHVRTYSPLLDRYLVEPDQQFTIELDVD
ncbi:metallophosphoesterase [Nannocystis punicea]|uniref:Metallophosphoesterase n=1 Tax=Nannocystis punicea TaxID=2995304 RepID=A0ABY7GXG2_9BACT|nr:metallophosphoesterase [Nannocystis poenicansa]WAS91607.1 metallophosphoesterase [Nannocystis poenicansa]